VNTVGQFRYSDHSFAVGPDPLSFTPLLPPVIKAVLVLSFMFGVVIEHQFER
jgi:hypothetical protein